MTNEELVALIQAGGHVSENMMMLYQQNRYLGGLFLILVEMLLKLFMAITKTAKRSKAFRIVWKSV